MIFRRQFMSLNVCRRAVTVLPESDDRMNFGIMHEEKNTDR